MTDREILLETLDRVLWDVMGQCADECEDRGESWTAAGWRWLAEHRRFPRLLQGCYMWAMCNDPRSGCDLPKETADHLRAPLMWKDSFWRHSPSLSDALEDAAVALGKMLEAEHLAAAKKAEEDRRRADRAGCKLCGGTGRVKYANGMDEACPSHGGLMTAAPSNAVLDLTSVGDLSAHSLSRNLESFWVPRELVDLPSGADIMNYASTRLPGHPVTPLPRMMIRGVQDAPDAHGEGSP